MALAAGHLTALNTDPGGLQGLLTQLAMNTAGMLKSSKTDEEEDDSSAD